MTQVYAKGCHDTLLKCLSVAKIGQGRPKSKDCSGCLTSAIRPSMNILARHCRTGTGNRKVGQGVLTLYAKVKVTRSIYPVSCMSVHDNVTIAVTVLEILRHEYFPLNMCQCQKRKSRSSKVTLMQLLHKTYQTAKCKVHT